MLFAAGGSVTTYRLIKTCEVCGKLFSREKGRGVEQFSKRRFCSDSCSNKSRVKFVLMQKECLECGDNFERRKRETLKEWDAHKFCSTNCAAAFQGKKRRVDIVTRFWKSVKRNKSGCWEWGGSKDGNGYGMLSTKKGKAAVKAHRLSWTIHFGEILHGLFVCHACDNPGCVNPDHLLLGTHRANIEDMKQKGRQQRVSRPGEKNNSALLTNKEAKKIRELYKTGEYTYEALSVIFPVKYASIEKIVRNESYFDPSYTYRKTGNKNPRPYRKIDIKQEEIVSMREAGFSFRKIGQALGCSRATARQRLLEVVNA